MHKLRNIANKTTNIGLDIGKGKLTLQSINDRELHLSVENYHDMTNVNKV